MKSVLISIQPYWVFLIIAKAMSWDIPQEKTIEVRKDFPKDKAWNKVVHIYCSKDKKSFNLIPAQYQPLMGKFIGKVIGEFVCDRIYELPCGVNQPFWLKEKTCIDDEHYKNYLGNKKGYGWHISDLKIYDKPRELGEFSYPCPDKNYDTCFGCKYFYHDETEMCCKKEAVRPPMSWCYVE